MPVFACGEVLPNYLFSKISEHSTESTKGLLTLIFSPCTILFVIKLLFESVLFSCCEPSFKFASSFTTVASCFVNRVQRGMATLNSPQPLSSSLQALLDMDVAISACSTIVSRLYPACNATLPPEPPPGSPESIVSPSSSTTPAQRAKLLLLKGKRLEIEIMTLAIEKSLKGNVTVRLQCKTKLLNLLLKPAHAKAIQAREALRERVATAALIVAKQEEELSTLKDRCTKQLEYLKEVQKYKANPSGPFPQPPIIGPTNPQQKSSSPTTPASPCLKRQSSSSSLSSPSSARRQCSMPSPRLSAPFSINSSPISSVSTPRVPQYFILL